MIGIPVLFVRLLCDCSSHVGGWKARFGATASVERASPTVRMSAVHDLERSCAVGFTADPFIFCRNNNCEARDGRALAS